MKGTPPLNSFKCNFYATFELHYLSKSRASGMKPFCHHRLIPSGTIFLLIRICLGYKCIFKRGCDPFPVKTPSRIVGYPYDCHWYEMLSKGKAGSSLFIAKCHFAMCHIYFADLSIIHLTSRTHLPFWVLCLRLRHKVEFSIRLQYLLLEILRADIYSPSKVRGVYKKLMAEEQNDNRVPCKSFVCRWHDRCFSFR